jgi:uncharacterized protein YwlG (UPF0340 family)
MSQRDNAIKQLEGILELAKTCKELTYFVFMDDDLAEGPGRSWGYNNVNGLARALMCLVEDAASNGGSHANCVACSKMRRAILLAGAAFADAMDEVGKAPHNHGGGGGLKH